MVLVFDLSLWAICLLMFFTGLTGGMCTMLATIFAMVADLHSEQERSSRFAILSGIGFYLAGVVGPLTYGKLVYLLALWPGKYKQFHLPFIANVAGSVALCGIVFFGVKESLLTPTIQDTQRETQRETQRVSGRGRLKDFVSQDLEPNNKVDNEEENDEENKKKAVFPPTCS